MRRKTEEKARTLTEAILEILILSGVCTVVGLLSQGRGADKLFRSLGKYSVGHIQQAIRRLRFQEMIEFDEDDEESPIVLTARGMRRAMKHEFLRIFDRPQKWDHFWRIVMFDIPERTGKRRNFQNALTAAGFYRLQDSVYACPFDLGEDIRTFARLHGVASHIILTTTASLGAHEKSVRKHFFKRTNIN